MDIYTATSCMKVSGNKNITAMCIVNNMDTNSLYFEVFPDSIQTNQKAELYCIKRILEIYNSRNVNIYSRSQYATNCINVWSIKWKEDNWSTKGDKSSDNTSVVKQIVNLLSISQFSNINITVNFISKNDYNEYSHDTHSTVNSKLKNVIQAL